MRAKTYKVYRTLASQASTSAPTDSVLANNLPAGFTWARTGAGTYTLTADAAVFTSGRTAVIVNAPLSGLERIDWEVTSTTVITFTTTLLTAGSAVATDAIMSGALIEARVYEA